MADEGSGAGASDRSFLARAWDRIPTVRALLFDVLAVVVVVIGWRVAFDNSVIILPPDIASPLTDKGLSGEILARRMRDVAVRIHREATTTARRREVGLEGDKNSGAALVAASGLLMPGSGDQTTAIITVIQEILGKDQKRVASEITASDGKLQLTIRVVGKPAAKPFDFEPDDVAAAMEYAGKYILKLTEPIVLASYLLERGELDDAEAALQSCLNSGNRDKRARALNLLGLIAMERKDSFAAADFFEQATRANWRATYAYLNWGDALAAQKNTKAAIKKYKHALATDSHFAPAWRALGDILLADSPEEAMRCYDAATTYNPHDIAAWNNWGRALYERSNPTEAVEKFRRAIMLDSKDPQLQFAMGIALLEIKAFAPAMARFQRATALDETMGDAWYGWAEALAGQGLHGEGLDKCKQATKLLPNDAPAWYDCAAIAAEAKQDNEALAMYQRVAQLEPEDPAAWRSLGQVQQRLGLREEANTSLKKAETLTANLQE